MIPIISITTRPDHGSLDIYQDQVFQGELIYDFGRTEDIPSGLSGTLLFGYEKSDFTEYGYLGTEWHYSWFNKYTERYYSWYAALGTFLNGYTAESGVFKVEVSILVVYTICPGIGYVFIVTWITCWESRGIRMIIFISRMLTFEDLIPIPLVGHNDSPLQCPQRCSCLT